MRETAAREKAEIASREKAAKEVERAIEIERRLRLSPAEKKAEIIEGKADTARRKAAVLLHNAERFRDAMAMVGEDIGAVAQDVVEADEMEADEMEAED